MKLWKALGVAGVAGVAATGVVVARAERRRRSFEPDEVRARLQERYLEAQQADEAPADAPPLPPDAAVPGRLRSSWARFRAAMRRRGAR